MDVTQRPSRCSQHLGLFVYILQPQLGKENIIQQLGNSLCLTGHGSLSLIAVLATDRHGAVCCHNSLAVSAPAGCRVVHWVSGWQPPHCRCLRAGGALAAYVAQADGTGSRGKRAGVNRHGHAHGRIADAYC
jgi:hypothetical protein